MSQKQIAEVFETSKQNVSYHLKKIFEEWELDEKVVVKEFLTITQHGAIAEKEQEQSVKFYNLDAVISVGYRVNSRRATDFRKWATVVLQEYVIK